MLPAPGSPWPPPQLACALDQFTVWDAWWAGDPEQLAAVYGGAYGGTGGRPPRNAGGIVGFLSRMWWGRPSPASETESKLHVPLAGDLARAAADMLFSEPLEASSDVDSVNDRLGVLLDDSGQSRLVEAAETVAALGGAYLRVVYDKAISDRAWFDTVAPDAALPVWSWGNLREVTFWRVVCESDGTVWRHYEYHTPGWIVHALYEGEPKQVGRPVPLQDRPETEALAALVNDQGAVETGFPGLDVTYIPHALPNPKWRRKPLLAPMGRSVFDGCEPLLDALDQTYSSWMRDIDLARGRVIVPGTWLDDQGPGRGATFDPDRKYFAPVPGALKMDRPEVVQFAIRVAEHRDTAADLVAQVLRRAGYSGQTLGEQGEVAVTATEVNARERRSFITRGRQVGYWRPGLAERALPALLAIDAHAFGRAHDLGAEINVQFADSVQPDELTVANTVDVLNRAQAVSVDTKVRMVHPDWSEDQVEAEVALLSNAGAPAPATPFDYGAPGVPSETDDMRAAAGAGEDDPAAEYAGQ